MQFIFSPFSILLISHVLATSSIENSPKPNRMLLASILNRREQQNSQTGAASPINSPNYAIKPSPSGSKLENFMDKNAAHLVAARAARGESSPLAEQFLERKREEASQAARSNHKALVRDLAGGDEDEEHSRLAVFPHGVRYPISKP